MKKSEAAKNEDFKKSKTNKPHGKKGYQLFKPILLLKRRGEKDDDLLVGSHQAQALDQQEL